MSAGWMYYHSCPPKRKCPHCGKRHSLKRLGAFSNGEDVWQLVCPQTKLRGGILASNWPEGYPT